MGILIHFLQKTIGQKIVVGLTGLGLCFFILIHMLGNLFILSGPEAYNRYAHQIHEFSLFLFLELGLLIFFLAHILLSILLFIRNKSARGDPYKRSPKGDKASPFTHKFLVFQGGILLIFLVFHLLSFKFGPRYETFLDGQVVRDIYQLVVENFKKPLYTVSYSFSLSILFIHLLRGLPASFKTLGLNHPTYLLFVDKLSWLFAITVSLGFLAPIWYIFIFK